jgi:hypothetical protein
MTEWLVAFAIFALCVLAILLFIQNAQGMKGDVNAAQAEFQQQVGYEYVSALTPKASSARRKTTPEGILTHYFSVYSEPGATVTMQTWELASPQPRTAFQLVEKKLVSTTRAFLNLVGPFKRTLAVIYPGPVPLGDADLDSRFALYSKEAGTATAIVRQPELRQELLALTSVTLLVDESGAIFCDPTDANVWAWGASRTDVNPAPAVRSAIKVHMAVERLLRRLVGRNSNNNGCREIEELNTEVSDEKEDWLYGGVH